MRIVDEFLVQSGARTDSRESKLYLRARTHKIANGDSDLIKARFGTLSGLKQDISRGPLRADFVAKVGDFSRGAPAAAS
jgi:hypothetical protein